MTGGILVLAAITLAFTGIGLTAPASLGQGLAQLGGFADASLRPWQNIALISIVTVHLILWISLLVTARRLFGLLAAGKPADAGDIATFLAKLLWGLLLWGLISQVLVSLIATWGFPQGERSVSIAFGTPQISVAFSALIASFMARAFALGAELWQDHREVI